MWWIVYSLQSTTNHRQIFKITKTGDLPLGNQADPSGLAQNWPLSHRTGQILSTKKPSRWGKMSQESSSPVSEIQFCLKSHQDLPVNPQSGPSDARKHPCGYPAEGYFAGCCFNYVPSKRNMTTWGLQSYSTSDTVRICQIHEMFDHSQDRPPHLKK